MTEYHSELFKGRPSTSDEDDDDLLLPGEEAFERAQKLLASVNSKAISTETKESIFGTVSNTMESPVNDQAAIPTNSLAQQLELYPGTRKEADAGGFESGKSQRVVVDNSKLQSVIGDVHFQNVDSTFSKVLIDCGHLDVLESYYRAAEKCYGVQSKLTFAEEKREANDSGLREMNQLRLQAVEDERNTWSLLLSLHQPIEKPHELDESFPTERYTHAKTEQLAFDRAFRANEMDLQRLHRVLTWLQNVSHPGLQSDLVPDGNSNGLNWRRSSAAINQRVAWPNRSSYVSKLDPDAPSRDNCCLHPEDEEDDVQLLGKVWQLVRAGAFCSNYMGEGGLPETQRQLEESVEALCKAYGQQWRAASLMGGRLVSCAPEDESVGDVPELEHSGNHFRTVWKEMCSKLVRRTLQYSNHQLATLEGGLYSVMAGDLDSLISSALCGSWADQCWAFCRLAWEARADKVSVLHREATRKGRFSMPGPECRYEHTLLARTKPLLEMSLENVFDNLRSSPLPNIRESSHLFFPSVQASLVEGGFAELLSGSICPFLCGERWSQMPKALVESVCGENYLDDYGTEQDASCLGGLQPQGAAAEIFAATAPCWELPESSTVAASQLRFTTHLSLYLQDCPQSKGVVAERTKTNPVAVTACLASYALHLGSEGSTSVLMNLVGRTCPALRCAVVASVLEAAAVADSNFRASVLDTAIKQLGNKAVGPVLEQTVRNAVLHWQNSNEMPRPFSLKVARVSDEAVKLDAERQLPAGCELCDWLPLYKLVENWRWLLGTQETYLSAVVFSNMIIRTLVKDLESRGARIGTVEWEAIRLLLQHLPEGVEDEEACGLSGVDALRERACWVGYVECWNAFDEWKEWKKALTRLTDSAEGPVPRQVVDELIVGASRSVEAFVNVFGFQGGWLCDEVGPAESNDPQVRRELEERRGQLGEGVRQPGSLKRACVPAMLNSYHELLFTTGETLVSQVSEDEEGQEMFSIARQYIAESLQVANLVAEEPQCLHSCFSKKELQSLLQLLRRSQVKLVQLDQEEKL